MRKEIKLTMHDRMKDIPVGQRIWFQLTLEEIVILFKFLTIPYYEFDEEDD